MGLLALLAEFSGHGSTSPNFAPNRIEYVTEVSRAFQFHLNAAFALRGSERNGLVSVVIVELGLASE
jgi:hypothetical protein